VFAHPHVLSGAQARVTLEIDAVLAAGTPDHVMRAR
jgi:hypothetical protein